MQSMREPLIPTRRHFIPARTEDFGPPTTMMKYFSFPTASRRHIWLVASVLLCLAGCGAEKKTSDGGTELPLAGVKLRLAVVDDPALATAITRASGEWNTQTGSQLEVVQATEKDLLSADVLPADAVICSPHLGGVLAEKKLLAPVPSSIVNSSEWRSILPLLKLREAAWGPDLVAVPFGSPVLTVYYRADLLEKLGRKPPQDWAEYQQLAMLLSQQGPKTAANSTSGKAPWCGAIEPLAPGWAGITLLARAAAYARHRDSYSTLFDIGTMEPLIAGPPFVRALEELVAAAKLGPANALQFDPTAARAAFWRGECGMTLSWPTAAATNVGEKTAAGPLPAKPAAELKVDFAELPGSRQSYNREPQDHDGEANPWEDRAEDESPRVTLLSIVGRQGVVHAKSERPEAAFQLLLWLSGSRMSSEISPASPATTLFREANLTSPGLWVEKPVPPMAAVHYADATEAALKRGQWLGALRMPGRADYLAAMDEAVAAAVGGQKTPAAALKEAAAKWQKITERLGVEPQRAAYRHSLGLE